jgi:hypothetical protein
MNADAVLNWPEIVFLTVFIVLVFGVPSLVAWASYSKGKFVERFDLSELWTHQHRIDKLAVILLGSWWAHTSAMVLETLLRTTQTQDWTTYQLWALPIIAKMLGPKSEAPVKPYNPTAGIVG